MDLVFNGFNLNDEPYTTSEVIAECAGIDRHAVQQQTKKHQKRLEKFGILAFEMRKLESRGHPRKVFHYNAFRWTRCYLSNDAQTTSNNLERG